jgi:hypothetical protein
MISQSFLKYVIASDSAAISCYTGLSYIVRDCFVVPPRNDMWEEDVMLSSVEAWWAGLCAQPFDGAQGDTPFLHYSFVLPFHKLFGEGLG